MAKVTIEIKNGRSAIDQVDNNGFVCLFAASQEGCPEVVKLLLKCRAAAINQLSRTGFTVLSAASERGHTKIVKLLLERKAEINQLNQNGVTSLILASMKGREEVVELLLKRKAEINQQSHDGATPLIAASREGHTKTVELLLKSRAEVNQQNHRGDTPLLVASQEGRTEVVKLLLESWAGISIAAITVALNIATSRGHVEVAALLQELLEPIYKILVAEAEMPLDSEATESANCAAAAVGQISDAGFSLQQQVKTLGELLFGSTFNSGAKVDNEDDDIETELPLDFEKTESANCAAAAAGQISDAGLYIQQQVEMMKKYLPFTTDDEDDDSETELPSGSEATESANFAAASTGHDSGFEFDESDFV